MLQYESKRLWWKFRIIMNITFFIFSYSKTIILYFKYCKFLIEIIFLLNSLFTIQISDYIAILILVESLWIHISRKRCFTCRFLFESFVKQYHDLWLVSKLKLLFHWLNLQYILIYFARNYISFLIFQKF